MQSHVHGRVCVRCRQFLPAPSAQRAFLVREDTHEKNWKKPIELCVDGKEESNRRWLALNEL